MLHTITFGALSAILLDFVDHGDGFLYLRLAGAEPTVNAIWAKLSAKDGRGKKWNSPVQIQIPGQSYPKWVAAQKGTTYRTLRTRLPSGLIDLALLHPALTVAEDSERGFYLLTYEDGAPSGFFERLNRTLSIPLDPAWADWLWDKGQQPQSRFTLRTQTEYERPAGGERAVGRDHEHPHHPPGKLRPRGLLPGALRWELSRRLVADHPRPAGLRHPPQSHASPGRQRAELSKRSVVHSDLCRAGRQRLATDLCRRTPGAGPVPQPSGNPGPGTPGPSLHHRTGGLMIYHVYYQRFFGLLTPVETRRKYLNFTHRLLRQVEAASLEDLYQQQQGEVWSPHGEARPLIRSLHLTHTSLSVGDVAQDAQGAYWLRWPGSSSSALAGRSALTWAMIFMKPRQHEPHQQNNERSTSS